MELVDENTCRLKAIVNADAKLVIPELLLNELLKVIMLVALEVLQDKASNLSDEYKNLIDLRQNFYTNVDSKIKRN